MNVPSVWWSAAEEYTSSAAELEQVVEHTQRSCAQQPGDEPESERAKTLQLRRLAHLQLGLAEAVRWRANQGFQREVDRIHEELEETLKSRLQDRSAALSKWDEGVLLLTLAEVENERLQRCNAKTADFDAVLDRAESATVLLEEDEDPQLVALAWLLTADVHRRSESCPPHHWRVNHEKTSQALDKALELLERDRDALALGRAKQMAGLVQGMQQDLAKCQQLLEEARESFRECGQPVLAAVASLHAAETLAARCRSEEARPHAELALSELADFRRADKRLLQALALVVRLRCEEGEESAVALATDWMESLKTGTLRQRSSSLMSLAYAHLALGKTDLGVDLNETAGVLVGQVGDPWWEFDYLLHSLDMYLPRNMTDEAEDMAMGAVHIAKDLSDKHREVHAREQYRRVLTQRMRQHLGMGWPDDSHIQDYLNQVQLQRTLCQELGDRSGAAHCLLGVVSVHGFAGRLVSGIDMAQECLQEFSSCCDKAGEAQALCYLAMMYKDLGQHAVAAQYAREMQTAASILRDPSLELKARCLLCTILLRCGKAVEAVRLAEGAFALADKANDAERMIELLLLASDGCLRVALGLKDGPRRGRVATKGLLHAKVALNSSKRIPSKLLEGKALLHLARAYTRKAQTGNDADVRRHDMEDAGGCLQEALSCLRAVGNMALEAEGMVLQGLLHLLKGRKSAAEDALEQAKNLALLCQEADTASQLFDAYNELQEAMGSGKSLRPSDIEAIRSAKGEEGQSAVVVPGRYARSSTDLRALQETLQEMVKMATGAASLVCSDTPLLDSGVMDSLTAVSFRNGLRERMGVKLATSVLFDYPTMKELSHHIMELTENHCKRG